MILSYDTLTLIHLKDSFQTNTLAWDLWFFLERWRFIQGLITVDLISSYGQIPNIGHLKLQGLVHFWNYLSLSFLRGPWHEYAQNDRVMIIHLPTVLCQRSNNYRANANSESLCIIIALWILGLCFLFNFNLATMIVTDTQTKSGDQPLNPVLPNILIRII